MRKENAKSRSDGDATRQALIDAAGILAARYGWSNVKAKQVCELAGVSAASVNYWFGGRDELYREVIRQIPEGVLDSESEQRILSNPDHLAALREILSLVMAQRPGRGRWHMALWAREMFTGPSEEFMKVSRDKGQMRITNIRRCLAAYLGIPDRGAEVEALLLTLMTPCIWVMALSPEVQKAIWPYMNDRSGKETLINTIIGNLERLKRDRDRQAAERNKQA